MLQKNPYKLRLINPKCMPNITVDAFDLLAARRRPFQLVSRPVGPVSLYPFERTCSTGCFSYARQPLSAVARQLSGTNRFVVGYQIPQRREKLDRSSTLMEEERPYSLDPHLVPKISLRLFCN